MIGTPSARTSGLRLATAAFVAIAGASMIAATQSSAVAQAPAPASSSSSAQVVDLRSTLTANLAEHSLLAGNAMAALLDNRSAEYQAAQATLNNNTGKIIGNISTLYGGAAGQSALPLWQRHLQLYADYANGVKAGDEAAKSTATQGLLQFAEDFGTLINSTNASVPQAEVAQLMRDHVLGTVKLIDALAAKNFPLVYSLAATDVRHMDMVSMALVSGGTNAEASGVVNSPASELRSKLALLFIENAALNANATGALINQRVPEFQAASAGLKDNTAALSSIFGNVYGAGTYSTTTTLWNDQSQKLAQYANALSNQDATTQAQARSNVLSFGEGWVNQLSTANATLPFDTLNAWGGQLTNAAVSIVDAQKAQDAAQEYQLRAQTNQTLLTLSTGLGQYIGQQFPNQFGAAAANVSSIGAASSAGSAVGGALQSPIAAPVGDVNVLPAQQVTSTTTATSTVDASSVASTTGQVILNPVTGADLSSLVQQVTGTVTGTVTPSATVVATSTALAPDATATSTILNPVTGADLSSSVQQVTGTVTPTATVGAIGTAAATVVAPDATATSTILNPVTGADTAQPQAPDGNSNVPWGLLVVIGLVLIASAMLPAFVRTTRTAHTASDSRDDDVMP